MSLGLLVLRAVFGAVMAAHGAQKLFGWFGGYGLSGTGGFMESLGFRPGKVFAALAGTAEFVGGLLVAAGLFGPLGSTLIISTMIVAAVTAHWGKGLFAQNGGFELPLLYTVAASAVALTGYGAYSIDALLGFASPAWFNSAAIAAGIIGGIGTLAVRRPGPAQALKQAA